MTEREERKYTADALSHLMIVTGCISMMAVFFFTDLATNLNMAICLTLAIPHSFFLRSNVQKLRQSKAGGNGGSTSN